MNTRTFVLVGLVATLGLSGCIGGDEAAPVEDDGINERAEDAVVTATTGSIHGTVASDLFEPLGGAEVLVQELDKQTKVARNGEFVFNDVAAGTYTVFISAVGFEQTARSVKVVAGEISSLAVQMIPSASTDPYINTWEEVGTVTVGASWQVEIPTMGCIAVEIAKNCGGVRVGVNGEHTIGVDEEIKTILAEMIWNPAGPLGEFLQLDLLCVDVPRGASGAVTDINHPCFIETSTHTSPVIIRVDEAHWLEHGYNFTAPWTARVFGTYGAAGTYEATGIDAGAAYEQKFTVIYSTFFRAGAPEGYTGIPDA